MKRLSVPIEVKKIETRADFSLGVKIETPELNDAEVAQLVSFTKAGQIWCVFIDKNPEIKDIESVELPDFSVNVDKKSMSQKVRAIIYRLWETTDRSISSEVYYRRRLEVFFNELQEELSEKTE